MRTNLKPAAAIMSSSASWPLVKWMLTPTPAGMTSGGSSAANAALPTARLASSPPPAAAAEVFRKPRREIFVETFRWFA